MTKNTTRKAAKAPEPMDPTIREDLHPVAKTNNQRPCWAIKQLVKEVDLLFPSTPYEVSNYNGRNTGLDVSFDASMEPDLIRLLLLVESDTRVEAVVTEEDQVLVSFKVSPRTYDSRDSFDLDAAWGILTYENEDGS